MACLYIPTQDLWVLAFQAMVEILIGQVG